MERRNCKDCEYFITDKFQHTFCLFNPPRISGEHQTGLFPRTHEDYYCSKWEPKWNDNPSIKEAWEQFAMVYKIITSGDGDI